MCSLTELIESALAAWRLASLLVNEDGPWAMFSQLRYWAGLRSVAVRGEDGRLRVSRVASNTWAEGLSCVWCVSVWIAALMALAEKGKKRGIFENSPFLRRALAVSAGAIIVHEVIEWLRSQAG
ncbi:MAG: hypothetical protein J7M34_06020 [Anaerolineae bacterium]|nr:hypothetical protein [Anaerolineae bacterium]